MSEDQLKAFLEAVKEDSGLQEKLNAAADVDAVVAIAKETGFAISADELQRAQPALSEDEELERVAGGVGANTRRGAACRETATQRGWDPSWCSCPSLFPA